MFVDEFGQSAGHERVANVHRGGCTRVGEVCLSAAYGLGNP